MAGDKNELAFQLSRVSQARQVAIDFLPYLDLPRLLDAEGTLKEIKGDAEVVDVDAVLGLVVGLHAQDLTDCRHNRDGRR